MRFRFAFLLALAFSLLPLGARAQEATPSIAITNLKVGEVAPDFTLLDNQWHPIKLSDYRGKKTVVLAFYVLAFTSG